MQRDKPLSHAVDSVTASLTLELGRNVFEVIGDDTMAELSLPFHTHHLNRSMPITQTSPGERDRVATSDIC